MDHTRRCSIEGCDRAPAVKRMCRMHYLQAWSGKPITIRPQSVSCPECAADVPVPTNGPVPTKCKVCLRASNDHRAYERRKLAKGIAYCRTEGCSVEIPRVPNRPLRCPEHSEARNKELRAVQSPNSRTSFCEVDDCGRPVRANALCDMHYKRILRAEGRIKADPWNDRRRNNYHARRARLNGGRNGDPVMLADLIVRDRSICAGCGDPVDIEIAWPHRLSKSIDHIIPVSRGGAHALDNCQLMHLGCNVSKGDRIASEPEVTHDQRRRSQSIRPSG